jgi:uncharacterized membrane protein
VKIFIFIIMSLLLSSCGYEHLKDAGNNNPIGESEPPGEQPTEGPREPTAINYATIHSQIIVPQCLRCHNASRARGGVVLETYELLTANLGRVQDAINGDIMPPSGPLAMELKQLLNEWVQSGAPRE